MAWSANKETVVRVPESGEWRVAVKYDNGAGLSFTRTYIIATAEELRREVLRQVEHLKVLDALNITTGPADLTPDAVTPPPTPTQVELDRAQWLKDYALWIKVKHTLIDTGILTGNETQVAALKANVQADFKAGYINYI